MIWTDWDFDYTDQLTHKYMKFRGVYYDVGTICKIKGPRGPVTVRFTGWKQGRFNDNFELIDASLSKSWVMYNSYDRVGVNDYCLEIIKPVYPPQEAVVKTPVGGREKPPSWDVEVAWIWYIVIMAVTVIFKDRIGLWILESIVFFGWKEGIFKGGKKK